MAERNKDLEIIKRKYGERMSHLCRELFPTLLETEGLLSDMILSKFNEDKSLYDIIVKENKQEDFKNYIYSFIDVENDNKVVVNKTPKELLAEAGYDFFECKTEKDIQSFKKYYASGEALCTFKGGRLDKNHVFWAVKKNVDQIKRKMFDKPTRQDEYGTSVISIQFAKGEKNHLSIKNRYNHNVNNPDATFGNNLDNIIEGLNESFAWEYGLNFIADKTGFELPNFTRADDGKLYRYNQEIRDIYYCPDNKIIQNGKVTTLDSTKQLLIDYFVVELSSKNKGVSLYDKTINDSFVDGFGQVQKIAVKTRDDKKEAGKQNWGKRIVITTEAGDITIGLDMDNRITSYDNPYVTEIGDDFLYYNKTLKHLLLPQTEQIGNNFLYSNNSLVNLSLEQVLQLGECFMYRNNSLKYLSLEQVRQIRSGFLHWNRQLANLSLPQVEQIGDDSLCNNVSLVNLSLEQVRQIGDGFLRNNESLKNILFPRVLRLGNYSLFQNRSLTDLSLPQCEVIGNQVLYFNKTLDTLFAPQLREKGDDFLCNHEKFWKLSAEQIRELSQKQMESQAAGTEKPSVVRRILDSFSGLKKPERQQER